MSTPITEFYIITNRASEKKRIEIEDAAKMFLQSRFSTVSGGKILPIDAIKAFIEGGPTWGGLDGKAVNESINNIAEAIECEVKNIKLPKAITMKTNGHGNITLLGDDGTEFSILGNSTTDKLIALRIVECYNMLAQYDSPRKAYKELEERIVVYGDELRNIRSLVHADENESTYDEVQRRITELAKDVTLHRNAEMEWEKKMMAAIGSDGIGEVVSRINQMQASVKLHGTLQEKKLQGDLRNEVLKTAMRALIVAATKGPGLEKAIAAAENALKQ